jgi:hypothetical protein
MGKITSAYQQMLASQLHQLFQTVADTITVHQYIINVLCHRLRDILVQPEDEMKDSLDVTMSRSHPQCHPPRSSGRPQ